MNDSYEMLKLDRQLCFPLYAVSREIVKKYKPYLDEINLTYTQYITMMVLWEQDEIMVKDIGTKLFLDSGTLTPVLNALEKRGLLPGNVPKRTSGMCMRSSPMQKQL